MAQTLPKPHEPAPDIPEVKRKRRLQRLVPLGLVLVIGAGGAATWYFLSRPQVEPLALSGRIEGYPTDVGTKVGGRIEFVAVREGDQVEPGDVIVRLDDAELQAQLRGATARIDTARQQVQQAQLQIDVVENQIQEAQLNVQQSAAQAQGQIYQAEAQVAAAEAQLSQTIAQRNQAQAELKLAQTNRDRFAQLVRAGAVTRQQFDQAQTTLETAQATLSSREAAVEAARRQVNALQGALLQAQTTGLNPEIRSTQLAALRRQQNVAQSQFAAAEAEVRSAQAAQQQIQAQLANLEVLSPIKGVVITRSVEPGQVVATGKTLLTLLNPDQVYLRGFIPEGQIGEVRVGQSAQVFLDSAPNRALAARVASVDTEASFTPENIYFREDRVKQVFGVRLNLLDPAGYAKPGMPADARILTEPEER